MAFHRFTQPSYPGIGALPSGPSTITFNGVAYNFINVISGGTGTSGSAFADAAKGSGPNVGSYLVAFGEDANSANANRGLRALAENTDYLDDLFNRAMAITVRTNTTTPVVNVSSIILPSGTFVGNSPSYPLDMLFDLVDGEDEEIIAAGLKVKVASITGASIGDGFTLGPVTLVLNQDIPAAQPYRVYYATQSSLASMPADALTFLKVRGAQEVAAPVELSFLDVKGSASALWDSAAVTNLTHLAYGGLNQRSRRSTVTTNDIPVDHPSSYALNTAGSGAYYLKDGAGMTAYSRNVGANVSSITGSQMEHVFGAAWGVWHKDKYSISATTHRVAYNSGFVFAGRSDLLGGNSAATPAIFAFAHTAQVGDTETSTPADDPTLRTQIRQGTTVSLTGDVITLTAPDHFYKDIGNGDETDIAIGYDILRVTIAGVVRAFHVMTFGSATTATLINLDGSVPNFGAATPGTIKDWHKMMLCQSDNPHDGMAALGFGGVPNEYARGFYYNAERANDPTNWIGAANRRRPARFFGSYDKATNAPYEDDVIQWGYRHAGTGVLTPAGALRGSGKLHTTRMTTEDWPQFKTLAGVSAPKSYTVRRALGTDGYYADPAEYNSLATGFIKHLTTNATALLVGIRPHDGCTLTAVTLWFKPSAHGSLPATGVQLGGYRVNNLVLGNNYASNNLFSGSAVLHTLPGLVANYSSKLQSVTLTCDQNNVIDNSQFMYFLQIFDESGGGVTLGNEFVAIDLTFTNITDFRPA